MSKDIIGKTRAANPALRLMHFLRINRQEQPRPVTLAAQQRAGAVDSTSRMRHYPRIDRGHRT